MSYVALYRKYRPNTFDGIVGQKNITQILKNQVRSGKISHAYIFSGTRGTGKTSAAKVLARAINCLNPQNGEPCNECEVCKNILEGNTTDVIEMDAASNNSVDNIRQIRQEVVYATIDVKYRVYIIDEVHMLTTSAFNALLKTLEEPPENVVFILATTEQHKIPVTILSRCLRFDFNRISDIDIVNRLKFVLEKEEVQYEQKALEYIAMLAEGGLRDALSILDRCVLEKSEELRYSDVLKIVGATDKSLIDDVVNNVLDYNTNTALEIIDKVIKKGNDLRQFICQITEVFLEKLLKMGEKEDKTRLIKIIDILSKMDSQIRFTTSPVIVLKACIVEISSISVLVENSTISTTGNVDINFLIEKVDKLDKKVELLTSKLNYQDKKKSDEEEYISKNIDNSEIKENKDRKHQVQSVIKQKKQINDIDEIKKIILKSGKLKLYSALAGATLLNNEQKVSVVTSNTFAYNILKMQDNIEILSEVLNDTYSIQKPVSVELEEKQEVVQNKMENLLKNQDINYTSMD
ncbi:MAG: DNA polymerase III subunit gamma/tau [Clostridia bacterium]